MLIMNGADGRGKDMNGPGSGAECMEPCQTQVDNFHIAELRPAETPEVEPMGARDSPPGPIPGRQNIKRRSQRNELCGLKIGRPAQSSRTPWSDDSVQTTVHPPLPHLRKQYLLSFPSRLLTPRGAKVSVVGREVLGRES